MRVLNAFFVVLLEIERYDWALPLFFAPFGVLQRRTLVDMCDADQSFLSKCEVFLSQV